MKVNPIPFLKENKEHLPLLSHYWYVLHGKKPNDEDKKHTISSTSKVHNTTLYFSKIFYKELSNCIDINMYEK
jgi:hypothetical protein